MYNFNQLTKQVEREGEIRCVGSMGSLKEEARRSWAAVLVRVLQRNGTDRMYMYTFIYILLEWLTGCDSASKQWLFPKGKFKNPIAESMKCLSWSPV